MAELLQIIPVPPPQSWADDDSGSGLKNFPRDDEASFPQAPIYPWPAPNFTDDDSFGQVPAANRDDESSYVITTIAGWVPASFVSEEEFAKPIALTEDEAASIANVLTGWALPQWVDNDELAKVSTAVEDDGWSTVTISTGFFSPSFADDLDGGSLANAPRDDETSYPQPSFLWYSPAWMDEELWTSFKPPLIGTFPGGVWTEEFRGLVFLEDARGLVWEAGEMNTLVKRPGERRTYIFRFSKLPEIAVSKDTLASIVSITATLATQPPVGAGTPPGVSNQAIASAGDITAFITNGDGGNSWLFICLADTAGGSRLACEGTLLINDG